MSTEARHPLVRRGAALLALLALGCPAREERRPRVPTVAEVGAEVVVVNYGPEELRVFPDRQSGSPRYVLMASERPQLHASWRPLGVSDRGPPSGYLARAGTFAWRAGVVIESALLRAGAPPRRWPASARPGEGLVVQLYDRDGKPERRVAPTLPGPCAATGPMLLQANGERVRGLVRCEGRAYLVSLAPDGAVRGAVALPDGEAELFTVGSDADYVLGGRRVLRVASDGVRTIGTVPPPGGGADTRELLLRGDELLVVDGAVGRVVRMNRRDLRWRAELRFPVGRRVERVRAAATGDRLIVVVAERAGEGTNLIGVRVPLRGGVTPPPLVLGAGPLPSDHEVVPVDDKFGGGALLVRTHQGNTGPLVSLSRLRF